MLPKPSHGQPPPAKAASSQGPDASSRGRDAEAQHARHTHRTRHTQHAHRTRRARRSTRSGCLRRRASRSRTATCSSSAARRARTRCASTSATRCSSSRSSTPRSPSSSPRSRRRSPTPQRRTRSKWAPGSPAGLAPTRRARGLCTGSGRRELWAREEERPRGSGAEGGRRPRASARPTLLIALPWLHPGVALRAAAPGQAARPEPAHALRGQPTLRRERGRRARGPRGARLRGAERRAHPPRQGDQPAAWLRLRRVRAGGGQPGQ